MRVSCSGCRVLRKGCSESCSIRPCLQWIKSQESQANATVFLAKFYGRAGLINLINAGPDHLRPEIFRSLLYEACGRIVNPVTGSTGLLWTGSWKLCQAAVDAVLNGGAPIAQIPSDATATASLQPYDIRHVSNDPIPARASVELLHKVSKPQFKRSATAADKLSWHPELFGESQEDESFASAEASHVSQGEPHVSEEEDEVELNLTLGLEPAGTKLGAVM